MMKEKLRKKIESKENIWKGTKKNDKRLRWKPKSIT